MSWTPEPGVGIQQSTLGTVITGFPWSTCPFSARSYSWYQPGILPSPALSLCLPFPTPPAPAPICSLNGSFPSSLLYFVLLSGGIHVECPWTLHAPASRAAQGHRVLSCHLSRITHPSLKILLPKKMSASLWSCLSVSLQESDSGPLFSWAFLAGFTPQDKSQTPWLPV